MSAFVYPSSSGAGGEGSGTGGGGGGGGAGGGGGPCGACKFLRRKCVANCIFAPYFNSENGATNFATVHKVFGASNVSKLLQHVPVHHRMDAVSSICYEAQARLSDPVYGCVSYITSLQQQVANLQAEIARLQAHLALTQIAPPPPYPTMVSPPLPMAADLPTNISCPSTYNLSFLIESMGPAHVQSPMGHEPGLASTSAVGGSTADGDGQPLARALPQRQASGHVPYNGRSSSA